MPGNIWIIEKEGFSEFNGNIKDVFSKKNQVVWWDITNPTLEEKKQLKKILKLSDLLLEDSTGSKERPKIESFDKFLFVILNSLSYEKKVFHKGQINFFIGKNFIVSIHKKPLSVIQGVKEKLKTYKYKNQGADYFFYLFADYIVDNYFLILDNIDDELNLYEKQIFKNPTESVLNNILKLKRVVLEFRKTVGPHRDIAFYLASQNCAFVNEKNSLYFRDLYDHVIRIRDMIDTYRDLIGGALDAYLSVISNRMNEIMKVLTIIATIIMPMTLITGIYGMNFKFMPEIHTLWGEHFGYYFAMFLMLLIAIVMIIYFKRKKWI